MIKSVAIAPGCIGCHNCEHICPLAFKVKGTSQVITDTFDDKEAAILEAAQMCPVQVIKVDTTDPAQAPRPLLLVRKKELTTDIVELAFRTPSPLMRTPGQYINCVMHDAGGMFSRAYSIAAVQHDIFILNVKCAPEGRGSAYIRAARPGDKTYRGYFGPSGFFTLSPQVKRPLLIATGTGLAPIYAMACAASLQQQITLLVGARTMADHYYLDRLATLPNVHTKVIVSRPDASYTGLVGRVTDHLGDPTAYDGWYICGNPAMVEEVTNLLHSQGVSHAHIHTEAYTPRAGETITLSSIRDGSATSFSRGTLNNLLIGIGRGMVIGYLAWKQYALLWDIAWRTVVITMSIRPLADITDQKWLRKALVLRQGFGIISSLIVVTARVFTLMTSDPGYRATYRTISNRSVSGWKICARLSERTGLLLLITSNTRSQKLLGHWRKKIHLLAWVYFFAAGIYIWSIGKTEALRSMLFVALLVIRAKFRK